MNSISLKPDNIILMSDLFLIFCMCSISMASLFFAVGKTTKLSDRANKKWTKGQE